MRATGERAASWRRCLWPLALVCIVACDDAKIIVIEPSVPPVLTDDNQLVVTLEDGVQVSLPIRGETPALTPTVECGPDVYADIGSLTFVQRTLASETIDNPQQEASRRRELTEQILRRRAELEQAFLDHVAADEYHEVEQRVLECNLVLQPDDVIYMRLRFVGTRSAGVSIGCLGDGNERAQIRNPASTSMLKKNDRDITMLDFRPSNCGIEPLTEGGTTYVDELGAIKSRCDPVDDVTITNCRIRGRIDAVSFGGDLSRFSMLRADHVQRLRESAAQHVTFNSVRIEGRYLGVVHFQPGVNHFTIQDSEIVGAFLGITVHLPADGGWNVLRDNKITGQRKKPNIPFTYTGKKREVISIDASEHNRIVNNHFLDMKFGAIEFYRNCGEKGGIRHRIPQYNQIINNVFDYSQGGDPRTLYLGSRDDKSMKRSLGFGVKGYCHKDEGRNGERFTGNDVPMPWDTEVVRNSSESNSDWVQNNVIADNQIVAFRTSAFGPPPRIEVSSKAKQLDNYLIGNEFAKDRSPAAALRLQRSRRAGCAVLAGVTNGMRLPFVQNVRNGALPYLRHGWTEKYFWDIRPRVRLACGTPLVCRDNRLIATQAVTCEEPIVRDFGSQEHACDAPDNVCVEGSNRGDEHSLGCGSNLLGVQAACNLEFGKATNLQRDRTLMNRVNVVRASDKTNDGQCTADSTRIRRGQRLILPWLLQRYDDSAARPNVITHACKERDRNGGDCHVNIRHYCEPLAPIE